LDLIVAALGSAAPVGRGAIGVECDAEGFVAVDRYQRSTSHPHVFAAGDVAARQDRNVPHSGVHAVHAGPVLAKNLRAALTGAAPTHSYQPRPASLYLLSTGNGSAIMSYGAFAAQGRWAGKLKRWIDKRWIGTYARLASGR
ncbi:MAG: FAD-dependent oxidoreductase, partial [Pseudomonadota bacterium]